MYKFNWHDEVNKRLPTTQASHAYKNIFGELKGEPVVVIEIGMSVYRNADNTYYGYVNIFAKDDFKNFASNYLKSVEEVKEWCEKIASDFLDSVKIDLEEA